MVRGQTDLSSFDPRAFERLAKLEGKHYWFHTRNEVIGAVMRRRFAEPGGRRRILEIGSGNGNVSRYLTRVLGADVWGADLFIEGLRYCRQHSASPLIQLDSYVLPFDRCAVDVICMFDVLEHLEDDLEVLREARRVLRPGGRIVLTVPAYQRLWSYFDEFSHHRRRYDRRQLRAVLERAGFEIEQCSYYMVLLLPLMILGRKLRGGRHGTASELAEADMRVMPVLNTCLYALCRVEQWLVPHVQLPFGSSILAVARAPGA